MKNRFVVVSMSPLNDSLESALSEVANSLAEGEEIVSTVCNDNKLIITIKNTNAVDNFNQILCD